MGDNRDEIPVFHSPILPIFLEVENIPHDSLCKESGHCTHRRKNGNCCHPRTLTATAACADARSQSLSGARFAMEAESVCQLVLPGVRIGVRGQGDQGPLPMVVRSPRLWRGYQGFQCLRPSACPTSR